MEASSILAMAWELPGTGAAEMGLFLGLGSVSAALISMAKAGFGSGVGLLAVPIMIYACGGDAPLATGIMLPLLILCDNVALLHWRGKWDGRQVRMLLPGTVVGVALGGAALWAFGNMEGTEADERMSVGLKLAIGLISLGFVALQGLRGVRRLNRAYRPGMLQGLGFGAVAGVTSTLAHAAGPVTAMYLLPQQLGKSRFVATTVLFYWLTNLLKLGPYVGLGLVGNVSLPASVALVPAVVVGALLGIVLHKRVGERSFVGVVYALLGLAGAHLTYEAVEALWF